VNTTNALHAANRGKAFRASHTCNMNAFSCRLTTDRQTTEAFTNYDTEGLELHNNSVELSRSCDNNFSSWTAILQHVLSASELQSAGKN